ncbi:uncharacterized protein PGTG_11911 [Puccinia graminis f. sp. tritici CRL 75-36-700-3]|uniref:Uncharacterized protein n=1 Tax=Puccinia graminis f. sp. tritici (strain CRL 75-36-700-3 / race SCCL) TaxID=418459 RepID=E3KMN0_PUCGT|nr:uncharacterized protein PGTG_11911 [Puccinia graminis f. sp. tritici CRL 75-36-700-3]EFP85555.2 hypothetical protein PGTG_11911 [Puccinia graminis f. sp. tritici CRL 75-36-700-3]
MASGRSTHKHSPRVSSPLAILTRPRRRTRRAMMAAPKSSPKSFLLAAVASPKLTATAAHSYRLTLSGLVFLKDSPAPPLDPHHRAVWMTIHHRAAPGAAPVSASLKRRRADDDDQGPPKKRRK